MQRLPENFAYVTTIKEEKSPGPDVLHYMQRTRKNGRVYYESQGGELFTKSECLRYLNDRSWVMKKWMGEEM